MGFRALIVDDDPEMRRMVSDYLQSRGNETCEAADGKEALTSLSTQEFSVILTDWKMKVMDGMEFLVKARMVAPKSVIIMITSFGSIESAVRAMELGANSYIAKPFELKDLYEQIEKQMERHDRLIGWTEKLSEMFPFGIIAQSAIMQRVFNLVERIKDANSSVLVLGASGTGKELIAKAIHQSGKTKNFPFVAINCAALPENILESELFGHVKGAFTGADKSKKGLFLEAEGGVLFMDEIGDMPLNLQGKLLRALQEKEVRPVGSNRSFSFHTRIVCATHRNLEEEISKNHFREDLYYRLNVIPIQLPTLDQRPEDIPLLANHFLLKYSRLNDRKFSHISEQGLHYLTQKAWKGNIRELENFVERAVILSDGPVIEMEDFLLFEGRVDRIPAPSLSNNLFDGNPRLEEIEHSYILKIYEEVGRDKEECAEILGISKRTLYRKLSKYRLDLD
jgi:two-component system, NtrC family, response regulator HydG